MGKPTIPNLEPFYQLGMDPKTGLPMKLGTPGCRQKDEYKKQMRIVDEQDAVNRYVWYNLPCNITSQELEKWLYYRGQLCFFYDEQLDKFFFSSYALDGTIDPYGRYNTVHPVPLSGGTDGKGDGSQKAIEAYFASKKLKCWYGVPLEELEADDYIKSCVLLHDYSKQMGQLIIPRQVINDPLIDSMAEILPMARTNLLASCGIKGMRVMDEDSQHNVIDAARSLHSAAINGEPWIPIIGNAEFQELTDNATGKVQDYFLALQSFENYRLSLYGIDNGGLFEKKAHELQTEADINGGPVGLVLQDGLSIRQHFCNIVNSIWGLAIWCEPAENVMGADANGDGVMYDRDDQGTNSGVENNGGSDNE